MFSCVEIFSLCSCIKTRLEPGVWLAAEAVVVVGAIYRNQSTYCFWVAEEKNPEKTHVLWVKKCKKTKTKQ